MKTLTISTFRRRTAALLAAGAGLAGLAAGMPAASEAAETVAMSPCYWRACPDLVVTKAERGKVTITNKGAADYSLSYRTSVVMRYTVLDGQGFASVPPIKAGGSVVIVNSQFTGYCQGYEVDFGNNLAESNEGNNWHQIGC